MEIRFPEHDKKNGIVYAITNDGIELPVIDVTHPAFAGPRDEQALASLVEAFVAEEQRAGQLPRWLRRLLITVVLRRARLGRAILAASNGFLDGMSTYVMKLGPDMLGEAYSGRINRKIVAGLPSMAMLLRTRDMAQLLSDGLAPLLAADRMCPLRLMNIAGGPAVDSLNALILLRQRDPRLLGGRTVTIQVLDGDADGPAFGARALSALSAEGAALHGLDVRFEHVPYDWRDVSRLRSLLDASRSDGAAVAVSSEGGLFEYGSDEEVVANLTELHRGAPADAFVVGSVTRADGIVRYMHRGTRIPTKPRDLTVFEALVGRAGWRMTGMIPEPFCNDVSLAKS